MDIAKKPETLLAGGALITSLATAAYLNKQGNKFQEQIDEIKDHLSSTIRELKEEQFVQGRHDNHIKALTENVQRLNMLETERNEMMSSLTDFIESRDQVINRLVEAVGELQDIMFDNGKDIKTQSIVDVDDVQNSSKRRNHYNNSEKSRKSKGKSMSRRNILDMENEDNDIRSFDQIEHSNQKMKTKRSHNRDINREVPLSPHPYSDDFNEYSNRRSNHIDHLNTSDILPKRRDMDLNRHIPTNRINNQSIGSSDLRPVRAGSSLNRNGQADDILQRSSGRSFGPNLNTSRPSLDNDDIDDDEIEAELNSILG